MAALGAIWGLRICSQDSFLTKERKQRAKRDRRTPQEASRGVHKGPQSSENETQRVQNWERKGFKRVLGRNVPKTSKSMTLSNENLDFGGAEGQK